VLLESVLHFEGLAAVETEILTHLWMKHFFVLAQFGS